MYRKGLGGTAALDGSFDIGAWVELSGMGTAVGLLIVRHERCTHKKTTYCLHLHCEEWSEHKTTDYAAHTKAYCISK